MSLFNEFEELVNKVDAGNWEFFLLGDIMAVKSELRTMLGFSEIESSSNASDDDESRDQDNLSSINDSKDSGRISDNGAYAGDVTEQCQEEDLGSVFTAMEAYDSSSAEDIGPYWNTLECTPYYQPIEYSFIHLRRTLAYCFKTKLCPIC